MPTSDGYGAPYPNQLMATALRISTPAACNARYGVGYFTSWNLCVGRADSTFCNGDSGGPHVVQAVGRHVEADRHHQLHAPRDRRVRPPLGLHRRTSPRSSGSPRSPDWVSATATAYNAGAGAVSAASGAQLGDFVAPSLTLKAQKAKAGHAFRLAYTVIDNSSVSAETVVIKKGSRAVAALKHRLRPATGRRLLDPDQGPRARAPTRS